MHLNAPDLRLARHNGIMLGVQREEHRTSLKINSGEEHQGR